MRVSGMTGSAVSLPSLKARTIGEHPSAWMTASLGMLLINPMLNISLKP